MIIEHTIPILASGSGFLGAAVMGYRAARRVRAIRKAIKARRDEKAKDREVLDTVAGVVAAVKGKVSPDFDIEAAIKALEAKVKS